MAKSRKKARKAAKRPATRRKARAKTRKQTRAKSRRPARKKQTSIIGTMADTVRETGELRRRLAGPNTFED